MKQVAAVLLWHGVRVSLLVLLSAQASAVAPGLYYDRLRNGHGLDLQQSGATLFGAFYTYAADGQPDWVFLQTTQGESAAGVLTRYRRMAGQLSAEAAGSFSLVPAVSCSDGVERTSARALHRFEFVLDGQAQSWCVEAVLPEGSVSSSVLNGAWYQPSDPGWGLFTHFFPATSGPQTYQTVYFHDAAGAPRWAFAQQAHDALVQSLQFSVLQAPCRFCALPQIQPRTIGTAKLGLISTQNDSIGNRIDLQLGYARAGDFSRQTALALLSEAGAAPGVASTREGLVLGQLESSGQTVFRNVPYAAPPVAELRLQAPQPAPLRSQLRLASEFGPGCPQTTGQGFFSGEPQSQSEDCLQLNIWSPATPGPHPVMVWIHGGGLAIGSAVDVINGVPVYSGAGFAARDVVLVSINYRIGPLGFLAVPELAVDGAVGNYGLQDQVAALQWLHQNIAQFGGDPQRLTIFGESAGGVSVCALLATPAARGLFSAAISQSGNCRISGPTLTQSLQQGERVASTAGCPAGAERAACLRALTPEALLAAGAASVLFGSSGESYTHTIDGRSLLEYPGLAMVAGRVAAVPVLLGINDDEHTSLAPASSLPATEAAYVAALQAQLGVNLGIAAAQRYPVAAYGSPQLAYQDLLDDVRFTCANRRAAADHAARGNAVYHYLLSEILPDPPLRPLQSFHGLDISLLFGPRAQALPPERQLAERMQQLWVDFAHRRNLQLSAGQAWPVYTAGDRRSALFDSSRSDLTVADYHGEACAFWANFVPL